MVDRLAGDRVALRPRRTASRKWPSGYSVGPCPFCSSDLQSKTDSRFECDADSWMCAACVSGGDIISYIAKDKGLDPKRDFPAILNHLGGVKTVAETPASAKRAGAAAYRRGVAATDSDRAFTQFSTDWLNGWLGAERAEQANERYRERERKRLYENYWLHAQSWRGTPLADYFDLRGLLVPDNARIGFMAECPMFADGKEREPLHVHTGPAMLCPILVPDDTRPEGFRFSGLHFTWLDMSQPKGKAIVRHPDTGEELPSKKSRGSKQGGYIDLGGCAWNLAERCVSGEGNENTLAGYTILTRSGRDTSRTHFRSGVDLGNLAGKAHDRLKHPTLKDAAGRSRNVPGVDPDLESPAMPVPENVRTLVWMCDGDSDAFTTQCAMRRAEARRRRADLKQVMMWPGDGADWNDRVQ